MTVAAVHLRVPMKLECVLRDVCASDLPRLEWFGTYAHMRRLEEANFREVQAGNKAWLVAVVNGFPAGHVKMNLRVHDPSRGNPRGYLFALRVFEPFQNIGIGTALIIACEDLLRERGYRFASIAVGKDNHRARRLYERLGYTIYREELGRWQYVDLDGRT